MVLVNMVAASGFAIVLLTGLAPAWLGAAEITATTDHIIRPTKIKPLDINSGSIDELKALPGIDGAYAQKIVDSRPYNKKDELVSKNIIPEVVYEKIKERIIAVPGSKGLEGSH